MSITASPSPPQTHLSTRMCTDNCIGLSNPNIYTGTGYLVYAPHYCSSKSNIGCFENTGCMQCQDESVISSSNLLFPCPRCILDLFRPSSPPPSPLVPLLPTLDISPPSVYPILKSVSPSPPPLRPTDKMCTDTCIGLSNVSISTGTGYLIYSPYYCSFGANIGCFKDTGCMQCQDESIVSSSNLLFPCPKCILDLFRPPSPPPPLIPLVQTVDNIMSFEMTLSGDVNTLKDSDRANILTMLDETFPFATSVNYTIRSGSMVLVTSVFYKPAQTAMVQNMTQQTLVSSFTNSMQRHNYTMEILEVSSIEHKVFSTNGDANFTINDLKSELDTGVSSALTASNEDTYSMLLYIMMTITIILCIGLCKYHQYYKKKLRMRAKTIDQKDEIKDYATYSASTLMIEERQVPQADAGGKTRRSHLEPEDEWDQKERPPKWRKQMRNQTQESTTTFRSNATIQPGISQQPLALEEFNTFDDTFMLKTDENEQGSDNDENDEDVYMSLSNWHGPSTDQHSTFAELHQPNHTRQEPKLYSVHLPIAPPLPPPMPHNGECEASNTNSKSDKKKNVRFKARFSTSQPSQLTRNHKSPKSKMSSKQRTLAIKERMDARMELESAKRDLVWYNDRVVLRL